jgi:hypothetical protein
MVEPLKENLVNLLLEGIHYDRLGEAGPNITDIIQGVINSFVSVEDYKRKGKLEVSFIFWLPFMILESLLKCSPWAPQKGKAVPQHIYGSAGERGRIASTHSRPQH